MASSVIQKLNPKATHALGVGSNLIYTRHETQHIPPQNHNTAWRSLRGPLPWPPGSSQDHGYWWVSTQGSNAGIVSTYTSRVCVTTNHCQEKREPGAKPVYTFGSENGGNRFGLDVVESSWERPGPCESTLKRFDGHLVVFRSVWI